MTLSLVNDDAMLGCATRVRLPHLPSHTQASWQDRLPSATPVGEPHGGLGWTGLDWTGRWGWCRIRRPCKFRGEHPVHSSDVGNPDGAKGHGALVMRRGALGHALSKHRSAAHRGPRNPLLGARGGGRESRGQMSGMGPGWVPDVSRMRKCVLHACPSGSKAPWRKGMSPYSPMAGDGLSSRPTPALWQVWVILTALSTCIVNESERCGVWSIALHRH
jgi:hypothetical protein